jgi:hypothetical protein
VPDLLTGLKQCSYAVMTAPLSSTEQFPECDPIADGSASIRKGDGPLIQLSPLRPGTLPENVHVRLC